MANRVIFQEAQTEPENQNFCWNNAQCSDGADLDSFGGDFTFGSAEKTF